MTDLSEVIFYHIYFSLRLNKHQSIASNFLYPLFQEEKNNYLISEEGFEFCSKLKISFEVIKKYSLSLFNIDVINSFPSVLECLPTEKACREAIIYSIAKKGLQETLKNNHTLVYLGRDIISPPEGSFCLDIPGGRRKYFWQSVSSSAKQNIHYNIKARFPEIIRACKDPDTKVVLSLSGGSLKSMAHLPLLRFLDACDLKGSIDEIWGTSAGAMIGFWYASDVSMDRIEQHGWDLYNGRYSLPFVTSKIKLIKNLIKNYFLPHTKSSNEALHFMASRFLEEGKIRIPFYAIAFNAHDYNKEILCSHKAANYQSLKFSKVSSSVQAVVASATVPILLPPSVVEIEGEGKKFFYDGAIVENVPLKSIYEKWCEDKATGREKRKKLIIVVNKLHSKNILGQAKERFHGINELEFFKLYDLALNQMLIESQEALILKDPNARLIETAASIEHIGVFDTDKMPEIFAIARKSIAQMLDEEEKKISHREQFSQLRKTS